MARRSIKLKTRIKVFERDNYTCQYCGAKPPEAILHIDHIVPWSKGGTNDMSNLITACSLCNLGKSDECIELPQVDEDSGGTFADGIEILCGWTVSRRTRALLDAYIRCFSFELVYKAFMEGYKKLGENYNMYDMCDLIFSIPTKCFSIMKGAGNG